MASACGNAAAWLCPALHAARAAGRARLRFRLPAQIGDRYVIPWSLAASSLLAGCHTLGTPDAFAVCQAADAATTLYALDRGAEELNPIVAAILDLSGPAGFIFAKVGVTVLVYRHYMEISSGVLAVASAATCGVAIHNANVARKLPPKPE